MRRSSPWITNRARVLRSQDVSVEHRLWSALRNRRLGSFKFVRQEAIGGYFADLACRELRLVVEVDGATHATSEEISRDERREAYLARRGYRVIADVRANLSGVLDTIMLELRSRAMSTTIQRVAAHPSPLPAGGEREER